MCMRPSFLLFSNSHYAIRLIFLMNVRCKHFIDRKYPKSWTIQDPKNLETITQNFGYP